MSEASEKCPYCGRTDGTHEGWPCESVSEVPHVTSYWTDQIIIDRHAAMRELSPEWPDGRGEATWFIDLLPGLDLSGSKDSPDE